MNDYKPSHEEQAAIEAIGLALQALSAAITAAKTAGYGTSYITHPLEHAQELLEGVLITLGDH